MKKVIWLKYPDNKPEEDKKYIVTMDNNGYRFIEELYGWQFDATSIVKVIAFTETIKPYEDE